MGTFSVGGLASGLDTRAIVDQLMSIERRGKIRLEWNRALWDARKSSWNDLNTRLNSLQTFANTLTNAATWTAPAGATSSDSSRLGVLMNGTPPAAGTYAVSINSLAANETWAAANTLAAAAPATSGVRQSGSFYSAANTAATGATRMRDMRAQDGTSLDLINGTQITMSFTQGGVPSTASFGVTNANTLTDFANWVNTTIPGMSATINADGSMTYTSAPGTASEVTNLSFSATAAFNASPASTTTMVAAATDDTTRPSDTLTFTQGTSTWNVAIAANASEADIAAAINGVAGIGVSASVVGGKLQIASSVAGAAGAFNVTSAGTLATDLGLARTQAAADARIDVGGTVYTRTTNAGINDVIGGVTLNLLATTTTAVTVEVKDAGPADAGEIKKKVLDFVNQYNSILDFVATKTGEQKVVNAKNLGDYLKGPLARDFGMSSISNDLRRWTTDVVGGLPDGGKMLADIGITTGDVSSTFNKDNISGKLVVDEAKLDAALASDPAKVQEIFSRIGGGALQDDGIARRVSALVTQWRSGGKVDAEIQGATNQMKRLQDSLDRFDTRLTRRQAYFERMFASLETVMGRMQSQNNYLSGQFASLSNG